MSPEESRAKGIDMINRCFRFQHPECYVEAAEPISEPSLPNHFFGMPERYADGAEGVVHEEPMGNGEVIA